MTQAEILLLVNSVLVALVGILFGVVGYFLKHLHTDFKALTSRVEKIQREVFVTVKTNEIFSSRHEGQIKELRRRIEALESVA